ncbi:HAD family phosphatase [Ahrensia kielensis]|uniref:HAD family phosphatase n=1 Tax=Ahrensia kielensis TaxID=76980 RepID=A0ABU9T3G3_9HYPH
MVNENTGAAEQAAPSLVIFDFDGVLADSERIALEELVAEMTVRGAVADYDTARALFLGASTRDHMAFVSEQTGKPCGEDFPDVWHERLFVRFAKELKPVAGAKSTLDQLNDANIPYCIASGGAPHRIAFALECLGFTNLFNDNVFSAEMVARGKPAPDLFLYAAQQMNVRPQDCIVIEDAVAGVKAANAAHMRCIGFLGGEHLTHNATEYGEKLKQFGANQLVSSHQELQALLNAMA